MTGADQAVRRGRPTGSQARLWPAAQATLNCRLVRLLASLVILLATHQSSHLNNEQNFNQVQALDLGAATTTTGTSTSMTSTTTTSTVPAKLAEQFVEQLPSMGSLSQAGAQMEGAKFSNLTEAIRGHPDLREVSGARRSSKVLSKTPNSLPLWPRARAPNWARKWPLMSHLLTWPIGRPGPGGRAGGAE